MPSGIEITGLGIAVLAVNLVARHSEALRNHTLLFITGWVGSILVIVGLGKMFFLDKE